MKYFIISLILIESIRAEFDLVYSGITEDLYTYLYLINDENHLQTFTTVSGSFGWSILGGWLSALDDFYIILIYGALSGLYFYLLACLIQYKYKYFFIFIIIIMIEFNFNGTIFTMSAIRQTFAEVFIILALFLSRQRVISLILVCLSISVHFGIAFFFLLVFFADLFWRRVNRKSLLFLILFLFTCLTQQEDIFTILKGKFVDYSSDRSLSFDFNKFISSLIFTMYLYLFEFKNITKTSTINIKNINYFYLTSLIVTISVGVLPAIGNRLFNTFYIVYIPIVTIFLWRLLFEKNLHSFNFRSQA
jgi:hypothetical protein